MKDQETTSNFDSHHDTQKRKWPYTEPNSFEHYSNDKVISGKKCITNSTFDYYQTNQQYQMIASDTQDHHIHQHCETAQLIDSMEINENIEYVNILYDDDLLTNIQAPVATETNYINFEPNWTNADILDLDQRNYYYSTPNDTNNIANITDLNGQLLQQAPQNITIAGQQNNSQLHDQSMQNLPPSAQNSNEYAVLQNVYIENVNGHDNATSNTTTHDDSEDKNLSWLYNYKLNELPHLSPEVNRSRTETGLQVDKLIQEATFGESDSPIQKSSNDQTVIDSPVITPKKPPFTYTELIEYALEDKGELTVSGIYNWISDRFPFYKSNDDRWKNSVRHNLSINPHFRKGNKAPQGAGHLWIISSRDSEANLLAWEHKKQRLELFFKMEKSFGQIVDEPQTDVPQIRSAPDETLEAVANLTTILDQSTSPNHSKTNRKGNQSDEDLKRSAGEILNGVKRTVEVQMVDTSNSYNFQDQTILDFPDYLNPVPKEQIVHECGLRSTRNNSNDFCTEYFSTNDMESIELGINMNANNDTDDGLFGDEFNLNYFITPGSNIMT